ncbi:MAG: hypothetical protein KA439_03300 [Rhizobacter sp.]|nr:hypothetical protein [Rhizobacter sp.]MBP6268312.1 hypothetical protein [Rhizobacter sp.]
MFGALKRLWALGPGRAGGARFDAIESWADRSGFRFRRAKDGLRFELEAASGGHVVRMEWGPSQRSYIENSELRMRVDMNLPGSLQMLVLTLTLKERLESETFERYTQDAQTVIDMSTPEEMRWLAMFPKADLSFDTVLRERFGALGANPAWALAWINGPLGAQLARAVPDLIGPDVPFVLMTMRGRIYLRMQLADPGPDALSQCLEVFDSAMRSVQQITGQISPDDAEWASTASTSWQTQLPDDEATDPTRF